jgi:DNA-binding NtrC family response regulator
MLNMEIKPLRERREDIVPLVLYFLNRMNRKYNWDKQLTKQALDILRSYSWPGNVRQRKNMVEQAAVLCEGDTILEKAVLYLMSSTSELEHPALSHEKPKLGEAEGDSIAEEVKRIERKQIVDALLQTRGNKKKAADSLGISRAKLYRKMKSM